MESGAAAAADGDLAHEPVTTTSARLQLAQQTALAQYATINPARQGAAASPNCPHGARSGRSDKGHALIDSIFGEDQKRSGRLFCLKSALRRELRPPGLLVRD